MKYFFTEIILITVISHCHALSNAEQFNKRKEIENKILENYDLDKNNVTDVNVTIFIGKLIINDHHERVALWIYLDLEWIDYQLEWDKTQYGNVTETAIDTKSIWSPFLIPIGDKKGPSMKFNELKTKHHMFHTIVQYSGEVYHSYSLNYRTRCEMNLEKWPHDIQNCSLKFGTPLGSKYKIHVYLIGKPETISEEWICHMDKTKIYDVQDSFQQVLETPLIFTRRSSIYSGIFKIPATICVVTTVSLLWLKPQNPNRLIFFCFLAILEIYILHTVQYDLPNTGFNVPHIVKCLNRILLAIFLCIIETVLMRVLCSLRNCPLWVYKINGHISKIKILHTLNLTSQNKARLMDSDEEVSPQEAVSALNNDVQEKNKLLENTIKAADGTMCILLIIFFAYILFSYFIL